VLEPIQPVVKLLTDPLPVVSQIEGHNVSLLDLADQFDHADVGPARDFVTSLNTIITLVHGAASGSTLLLQFGNFDLGGYDARRPGTPINVTPNRVGPAPPSVDSQVQGDPASSFLTTTRGTGLTYPFISNPSSLFGLFLGKDADL